MFPYNFCFFLFIFKILILNKEQSLSWKNNFVYKKRLGLHLIEDVFSAFCNFTWEKRKPIVPADASLSHFDVNCLDNHRTLLHRLAHLRAHNRFPGRDQLYPVDSLYVVLMARYAPRTILRIKSNDNQKKKRKCKFHINICRSNI